MYTVVLERKNREKFVRWYCRQSKDVRRFFIRSFINFNLERQNWVRITPSQCWRYIAGFIFDELQRWDVERLYFLPLSLELRFIFHPFTYFERESEFLKRDKIQSSFEN